MSSANKGLAVDGVFVLTEHEATELSYCFPEGAELPAVLQTFLIGSSVDAHALANSIEIDGEASRAIGDSDRAQELLRKARERLRAHPDLG